MDFCGPLNLTFILVLAAFGSTTLALVGRRFALLRGFVGFLLLGGRFFGLGANHLFHL
jgi:hypothetical protein